MIDKTHLKLLHTKQLLKVMANVRAYRNQLNSWGKVVPLNECYVNPFYHLNLCSSGPCSITLADIYEELATRPHVPNKAESKQLRKEKHARGKNKGRHDKLWRHHIHLSGHNQNMEC